MLRTLRYLESHGAALLFRTKLLFRGLHSSSRIFSHTTLRERKQLFNLSRGCPQNARALEIGSYLGASACFISAGLRVNGGHLYCVDTWNNETMPDGVADTFSEFQHNVARYQSAITVIRKRSEHLTAADVVTPLDLVFLDGDHSEAAVTSDFVRIAPWVRPGGIVIFHDCLYFRGVAKVIGAALSTDEWQLKGFIDNMLWLMKTPGALDSNVPIGTAALRSEAR